MPRGSKPAESPSIAPSKPPLPKGWQWMRFDQIATNVSDRIDDPKKAGVEHYVGLEHLDSDSLKIRRWGTPDDVEAQKLRFRSGDIIFGKRRAYQRKVGVAEFEGICSAHAFVFRGNTKHIVPELLPYFMQTDAFMERAVAISKGSLSPTINWGDLARQEFALPSDPAEQRRIAELLAAADEAVEGWRAAELSEIQFMQSLAESAFGKEASGKHKLHATAELLIVPVQNGVSPETNASGKGVPSVSLSAIQNGLLNAEGHTKHVVLTRESAERFRIVPTDLYVIRGNGSKDIVGRCARVISVPTNCIFPDLLMRLRFDLNKIRPMFAWVQWNSSTVHASLIRRAKSTNGIWKVNGQDVAKHELIVPPLKEQDRFLKIHECHLQRLEIIKARLTENVRLRSQILAHLLNSPTEPT